MGLNKNKKQVHTQVKKYNTIKLHRRPQYDMAFKKGHYVEKWLFSWSKKANNFIKMYISSPPPPNQNVTESKKKTNSRNQGEDKCLTTLRRIGSKDEQSFCKLSTLSASTITLQTHMHQSQ